MNKERKKEKRNKERLQGAPKSEEDVGFNDCIFLRVGLLEG